MTKNEFEALTVKEIKTLLETTQFEFDVLLWAQEDSRSSVRKLAAAYVMRQKKQLAEFQRLNALYTYENSFYEEGIFEVAGVDEVGRGPIAGPVTVAAVILPPNAQIEGLNDSKKIAPHKRELIMMKLCAKPLRLVAFRMVLKKLTSSIFIGLRRRSMYVS